MGDAVAHAEHLVPGGKVYGARGVVFEREVLALDAGKIVLGELELGGAKHQHVEAGVEEGEADGRAAALVELRADFCGVDDGHLCPAIVRGDLG
jgi:hypothetical protein